MSGHFNSNLSQYNTLHVTSCDIFMWLKRKMWLMMLLHEYGTIVSIHHTFIYNIYVRRKWNSSCGSFHLHMITKNKRSLKNFESKKQEKTYIIPYLVVNELSFRCPNRLMAAFRVIISNEVVSFSFEEYPFFLLHVIKLVSHRRWSSHETNLMRNEYDGKKACVALGSFPMMERRTISTPTCFMTLK